MILIGVIIMGFLLISMTLVMNGFLYTQTIESEGVPPEVNDIASFQQEVTVEYGTLLVQSNEHDSHPRVNYTTAVTEAGLAIRANAVETQGRVLNVSHQAPLTNGTLLRQTDGGTFTDADGDAWTLTASDLRRFQIAVNTNDLHEVSAISTTELDDAFHITVTDDGGTAWTVYVAKVDDSDPVIAVDSGSGPTRVYDADNVDALTLDIGTGSISEANTTAVDATGIYADGFAANLATNTAYQIEYHNPENVTGNYALTVPDDDALVITGFNASDPSLYQKNVTYSAQFNLTYESPSHFYTGVIEIAPCAPGDTQCVSYIRADGGP